MNFQWNEELIKEMIWSKLPIPEHYVGNVQKCLDEFKKSKEQNIVFNEEAIKTRLNELAAMEKGFNIAEEGQYETFWDYKKSKEQKSYEILSLKYEKDKKVYPFTYLPNGFYINSVKRLSDGEVFTVGDLVKWNNSQTPFLIESFEENNMHPTKKRMFCNNKIIDICYLEKVESKTDRCESPIAFERELQILINKHSEENDSNTPDYILANFLSNCLKAFNGAVILKDANLGL